MDAQAKKKSVFRARLNAQNQEKQRIDSPLVRYNEHGQPVCRVCDVVIKSDSLWPAHQASRKHHEAIKTYKANALKASTAALAAKSESAKELPKPKAESFKSEPSTTLRTHQPSTMPSDYFDNHDKKRQKNDKDSSHYRDTSSHMKDSVSANTEVSGSGTDRSTIAPSIQTRNTEVQASKDSKQVSGTSTDLESKHVKGALPAGFFDDKDSDLRARGIKPVKPDVKDEYKEFEKLIQDDLQEIDNRLEEEEFVAAEVIEEEETVEQRAYIERVELLRKKKLELRDSRSVAVVAKDTEVTRMKPSREDSSSDEDDDFKVDWRAKRL